MIWILEILICTGLIFLQIYLSKKNKKFLGFILPTLLFASSLVTTFTLIKNIYFSPGTTVQQIYEGGKLVSKSIITHIQMKNQAFRLFIGFLLLNIPTMIFLLISIICKKKNKQNKIKLDKMKIQDL